ncbi:MAG: hypothetical protein O2816_20030 [Planctomycetota bacterium]|nr:hypothetical protein [Planctomycetota bacterium]
MKAKLIKWALVGTFVLGTFGMAETRGWALGGKKVKDPITQTDLRSGTPGSWHYVYWYHGTRGK